MTPSSPATRLGLIPRGMLSGLASRLYNTGSGKNLSERVALLKAPFEEIYATEYPKLSYVHFSLSGFANLKALELELS